MNDFHIFVISGGKEAICGVFRLIYVKYCGTGKLFLLRRAKPLAVFAAEWYNILMENNFVTGLDEHFCAVYSDYVRISALEGYQRPDLIFISTDGNVARRNSELMRLSYQKDCAGLLKTFKNGLSDTEFTFSFSFIPLRERLRDLRRKYTFAKILPSVLARYDETVTGVGEKLDIEPRFWQRICKGKLYPEKNTILALALVCRVSSTDLANLLAVCGFSLKDDNVRDVVVSYLVERKIFNEEMRDLCLAEYKITCLPIKRLTAE